MKNRDLSKVWRWKENNGKHVNVKNIFFFQHCQKIENAHIDMKMFQP